MGLVGCEAPLFTAKALVNGDIKEISLVNYRGRYVVLFFYPLDFTFVCPTELHAFQESLNEFTARNTQVIGCSVDSPFSHAAWHRVPRCEGGIAEISYPIISDLTKSIATAYDVLKKEDGLAYRGLFLIDTKGIVRHLLVNDLPLGRSVDEALRMIDALQFFEQHGEVCPANWKPGLKSMKATAGGVIDYFRTCSTS